ncbi:N-terminal nucleophile aminohydrolase [Atractiella rhizophila]|nr:N-terminal nucleophile aminohydrolase [Atractiella rhizophila]
MTSIGTGYDLSTSTYSPDGRIFQVEYASKTTQASGTVIGLRTKDGVVIAVEKLVQSKLMVKGKNGRIGRVEESVGLATAGLLTDGRHIISRARDEAQQYKDTYRQTIPLKMLADRIGSYCQAYTLYSSVRPFGVSIIIAGVDADGKPGLYNVEPSGTCYGYRGCAVGKGRQLAKTEVEKLKLEQMSTREAVFEAARIIHMVHDESKDKDFELEMSWVGPETKFQHELVPDALLEEANQKAKDSLSEGMED